MATELEQFVEANKQRLGEVNASNPQLYSAISMALDYLNKQYFGATTEMKVDIPQPTPVTPVQSTQTESVERLFTDEELKKHIMDNVWTFLDFKEIKIELTNDIQKQNFLNLIKLLLDRDTYVTRGNIGNYFYTDEDLVVFNYDIEDVFRKAPNQLLYYNQIFADLLKSQQTPTKLTSVWDSVYAYSSKDYATPIDYNFLQKAIYSNRRSKDMKLEIARAFGEIKSIDSAVATNWAIVEKVYGKSTSQFIYKYEINDEVYQIIGNFGYDFNNITQYTDLEAKDWISDLIFTDFEYPLKDDRVKEKLLEWYRNQINKPTAQTHTPKTTQPNEFKPIWRFKTKQEFIDEYGSNWKEDINWNLQGAMDYLLGQPITNPMFDLNFSAETFDTAVLGIDSGRQTSWYLRPYYFKKIEDKDEEIKTTPQSENLQNAKFKVGDRVKIIAQGAMYSTFTKMFKKMGFANQIKNDEAKDGDIGTIFGVDVDGSKRIIYGVLVELGATRKYQTLIGERGLELFQPTPLSASKIEVGDWVRLVNDDSLVNVPKGVIGKVVNFDSVNDPWILWQENKLVSENGYYTKERFELALKNPKPIFKIGDLVRWKEDVYNYNVKKGAYASVVGFGVFDGNILANVEWIDTKGNNTKVGGQSDGGYSEDFFELALSNKEIEQTTNDFIKKITIKTPSPAEPTITTTSEDKDEEDFEDLADELENLDF